MHKIRFLICCTITTLLTINIYYTDIFVIQGLDAVEPEAVLHERKSAQLDAASQRVPAAAVAGRDTGPVLTVTLIDSPGIGKDRKGNG